MAVSWELKLAAALAEEGGTAFLTATVKLLIKAEKKKKPSIILQNAHLHKASMK